VITKTRENQNKTCFYFDSNAGLESLLTELSGIHAFYNFLNMGPRVNLPTGRARG